MKKKRILTTSIVAFIIPLMLSAAEKKLKLSQIALQTPSVCKAPDGTYYLTGTSNINTNNPKYQDFKNNDGVRLWKSRDLENWEAVGLVWDFAKDGAGYPPLSWVRYLRPDADHPDNTWHHGATDVRLQHLNGKFHIVMSANHYGVLILESAKDDPASSYTQIKNPQLSGPSQRSRLNVPESYSPAKGSLFEDDDGSVYLIWNDGLIVKLTPDLSNFGETPWNLLQCVEGFPDRVGGPATIDPEQFFLLKNNGRYHLFYTAWILDGDRGSQAVMTCAADSIRGPYSTPEVLLKGAGPATIAMDGPDAAILAFSQDDHPALKKVKFVNGQPSIETK